jgi:transcriptional regulator with XRE-family HTH domain
MRLASVQVNSGLDWSALGRAVQDRRYQLGLSQNDVTARGGPSHQTLRNIEQGRPGPHHGRTLANLERVLEWKAGAAVAILGGATAEVDTDQADEVSAVLTLARSLSRADKVRAIHEIAIMLAAD